MIELDVSYFGRRDASDFFNRDIDHRTVLPGPPCYESPLAMRCSSPLSSFAVCLVGCLRDIALARQLGERPLLLQPRVILFLFLNDDLAPHLRMRDAAQFCTEHLEGSGSGGREPEICDSARYHIHLRAELGDIESMKDID